MAVVGLGIFICHRHQFAGKIFLWFRSCSNAALREYGIRNTEYRDLCACVDLFTFEYCDVQLVSVYQKAHTDATDDSSTALARTPQK